MQQLQSDIVIIGGGLTGLSLAYLLRDSGLSIRIIEARNRLGGRIYTVKDGLTPVQEMGATWLGQKHSFLWSLLKELNITVFEQLIGERVIFESDPSSPPQLVQIPPNDAPSFRIKGGSFAVIEALQNKLSNCEIQLNQTVSKIIEEGKHLILQTTDYQIKASTVVSTLPPHLLMNTVLFQPSLPANLLPIMQQTHTWMGESIKIALSYKKPFWRAKNTSGTIFSHVGPITEFYDHTDFEGQRFALMGFLQDGYFSTSKAARLQLILQQLRKYYGSQVDNFLKYEEAIWRKEQFTAFPYQTLVFPHQNNGHAMYQQAYLQGKLLIGGTETATAFSGYMEGAIRSATHLRNLLKK